MHIKLSKNKLENFAEDDAIMMTSARSDIKCLTAEKGDRIYLGRT